MTLIHRPVLAFGPVGTEPPFEEILADPIIRLLMARDGISDATLRALTSRPRLGCPSSPEAQDDSARNTPGADQLLAEVAP